MSWLSSVATGVRVALETKTAAAAFLGELEAGRGPIAAVRAFAGATSGQLDDQVVVELEAIARKAVDALSVVVGVAADAVAVAERARPGVVRFTLGVQQAAARLAAIDLPRRADGVVGMVVDVGYRAGAWRAQLETWRRVE